MKLTVEMAALRKHVNFVKNGLGCSKTDLPVLLMWFDVSGEKMKIFTSNKEMFCRTEMKVQRPSGEEKGGSFTLIGSKMERLVSQVEAEALTFVVDEENLEVQAGLLTVNFELYDGSAQRTVEVAVKEHLTAEGLSVSREALEEAMNCAKSCVTVTSIRPDITHMEIRKQRALSSDGRKVTIYKTEQFPEDLKIKVPGTALTSVIAATKNAEGERLEVVEGKSYFYFKGGSSKNQFTFGVRKVERSFPNIEEQIEKSVVLDDEVSVDKKTLEAILRGVALGLASEEVGVDIAVQGVGKEATIEVASKNSVGRKSYERASVGRKLERDLAFPVSFKHLLDTLSVFKGDSVVELGIVTARNVLMVFDKTAQRSVTTVIPFRTQSQIAEENKEKEALSEAKRKQKEPKGEGEEAQNLAGDAVESE